MSLLVATKHQIDVFKAALPASTSLHGSLISPSSSLIDFGSAAGQGYCQGGFSAEFTKVRGDWGGRAVGEDPGSAPNGALIPSSSHLPIDRPCGPGWSWELLLAR